MCIRDRFTLSDEINVRVSKFVQYASCRSDQDVGNSFYQGMRSKAFSTAVALKMCIRDRLETALFHRLNAKKCAVCRALFIPGSNRAKYCPECAARMKRINAAKRKRKQREKVTL